MIEQLNPFEKTLNRNFFHLEEILTRFLKNDGTEFDQLQENSTPPPTLVQSLLLNFLSLFASCIILQNSPGTSLAHLSHQTQKFKTLTMPIKKRSLRNEHFGLWSHRTTQLLQMFDISVASSITCPLQNISSSHYFKGINMKQSTSGQPASCDSSVLNIVCIFTL